MYPLPLGKDERFAAYLYPFLTKDFAYLRRILRSLARSFVYVPVTSLLPRLSHRQRI